jgi:hypothetical protein
MEALGRPTVGLSGRSSCLALEPDVSQPALSASSFAERQACPGLHTPGPAGEATFAADRNPFEVASRSTYVRTELQGTQAVIRHEVCAGVRCYYRTLGNKTCGFLRLAAGRSRSKRATFFERSIMVALLLTCP